ncbi:hypothetical protein SKAU_G00065040 [Synaphobranchus kaupii]|uniref:PiggyBac transposable element-derived protein 4 C-terminal zinc-finger domain-containing protein n=1 Tax=Synaphobranchus kaupii TaxID=118154 RepID=A0A9Q1G6S9_SYNKA|nr:hypothetical protein SKAU_G00065040 [Synaphobranchus kaupii]
MPGYRYDTINACPHMSDPAADILNDQLRGQAGYDGLFRLKPLQELDDVGKNGSTEREEDEEVATVAPQPQEVAVERRPQGCFPVTVMDVSSSEGRRLCVLCLSRKVYNKTTYKCRSCDVPLCMVAERICFTEWHEPGTMKD